MVKVKKIAINNEIERPKRKRTNKEDKIMNEQGVTVREAAQEWVQTFNAIQRGIIDRLMSNDPDEWSEVTWPSRGNQVYVYEVPDGHDNYGRIAGYDEDEEKWKVSLNSHKTIEVEKDNFKVIRDGVLPMWDTMWSFSDSCDNGWLDECDGIRIMSECGFRIYKHEEFGYFFGIDGAGYGFYTEHWMPLYRARGLQWHNLETEREAG